MVVSRREAGSQLGKVGRKASPEPADHWVLFLPDNSLGIYFLMTVAGIEWEIIQNCARQCWQKGERLLAQIPCVICSGWTITAPHFGKFNFRVYMPTAGTYSRVSASTLDTSCHAPPPRPDIYTPWFFKSCNCK